MGNRTEHRSLRHIETRAFKEAFRAWKKPQCQLAVSALAFSTLFSLLPFLIVLMSIIDHLRMPFLQNAHVFQEISSFLTVDEVASVRGWLKTTLAGAGKRPIILSLILISIGARSVFVHLQQAVSIMWEDTSRKWKGWQHVIRSRAIAIFMIVITIAFILVSFVTDAELTIVAQYLGLNGRSVLLEPASLILSVIILGLLFTITFKFVTGSRLGWRSAVRGASSTALLLTVTRAVSRIYFSLHPLGSQYGPAAWAVAIPLWVYLFWQIFMLGLLLTWGYQLGIDHTEAPAPPPQQFDLPR